MESETKFGKKNTTNAKYMRVLPDGAKHFSQCCTFLKKNMYFCKLKQTNKTTKK